LTYPSSQTIIQASWNWPFSRKDMEVYGTGGLLVAKDGNHFTSRYEENKPDSIQVVPNRKTPYHDPFSFFKAVVRKEIVLHDNDLSGLPVNMVVMEILDAARRSAHEKKTIFLARKQ
jgi:predicted dehydrogenase